MKVRTENTRARRSSRLISVAIVPYSPDGNAEPILDNVCPLQVLPVTTTCTCS